MKLLLKQAHFNRNWSVIFTGLLIFCFINETESSEGVSIDRDTEHRRGNWATTCSDGVCSSGESCQNCPTDCGFCSETTYYCNTTYCQMPSCHCAQAVFSEVGGADIPQFVSVIWEGPPTRHWHAFREIAQTAAQDALACGPRQTFFSATDGLNYYDVQLAHAYGSEIGDYTVTRNTNASSTLARWRSEIVNARSNLVEWAQVPFYQIEGFRAPGLAVNPDMFWILAGQNFSYDSSLVQGVNQQSYQDFLWPYTLDYGSPLQPVSGHLPPSSVSGLWEFPIHSLRDENNSTFDITDGTVTSSRIAQILEQNFLLHYHGRRAPFSINLPAEWLDEGSDRLSMLKDFLRTVSLYPNVVFATPSQIIAWMRSPKPVSQLGSMSEFACNFANATWSALTCNGTGVAFLATNTCCFAEWTFDTCSTCPLTYPSPVAVEPICLEPWYRNKWIILGVIAGGVFVILIIGLCIHLCRNCYKYMIAEAAAQAAAAAATAATTPQPGKDARPKSIALNDITIESQHTEPSSNADQSVDVDVVLKRLQRGISVMVDEVRPQILELEQQTETVNTVEEAQSLHMAYMNTAQHYVGLCQKLEEYAIEAQKLPDLWRTSRDLAALCRSNMKRLLIWDESMAAMYCEPANDESMTEAARAEAALEENVTEVEGQTDSDDMTEFESDEGSPLVQPKTPTQLHYRPPRSPVQAVFSRKLSMEQQHTPQ